MLRAGLESNEESMTKMFIDKVYPSIVEEL
jgi:hypothetical protein